MGKIRLDKYLADMGIGARSEVKTLIRKGRVTVDGVVCRDAQEKIDTDGQSVCVDGAPVSYQQYEYLMLYKPSGCVTATRDAREQTVMDLLSSHRREALFPVGRLDKDTQGLLLITDDGALAHRLMSPASHVDKTYFVRVAGSISDEGARLLRDGMDIGEKRKTKPARLEILKNGELSEALLTISEGKFHQVKRMFHGIGCEVVFLKRLSMGSLWLDERLQPGEYRALTEEEVQRLKEV